MSNTTNKEDYITICPKCGSKNVSFEKNPAYVVTGLINQFKECENCGYHGMLFPQVPRSEVPEMPKNTSKLKDRELVQKSFGRGYMKYLIYVGIPFLILTLILLILRK